MWLYRRRKRPPDRIETINLSAESPLKGLYSFQPKHPLLQDLPTREYMDSETAVQMGAQIIGSLMFDLAFIAFGIANTVKAYLFMTNVVKKNKQV